mgnify:CR=1 FL=1
MYIEFVRITSYIKIFYYLHIIDKYYLLMYNYSVSVNINDFRKLYYATCI